MPETPATPAATQHEAQHEEKISNPYAGALGEAEARKVLGETAAKLAGLLTSKSPEELNTRPGPHKWSTRELLCHLADCELAFGFRLRQIYAGEPTIQTFAQDPWSRAYAVDEAYTAAAAVAAFSAFRSWNLVFIDGLSEADRMLTAQHPERGTVTLEQQVETVAGHDAHHLKLLGLM